MEISHTALPKIRLCVLTVFVVLCTGIFGYMWINSGGRLPVVSQDGYRITATIPKVSNLVDNSDVTIAGVQVGKVADLQVAGNAARVTIQLDKNAPLHQGATIQVREKTLVDETFLEVTDGRGAPLGNGAALPDGSAKPAVELNDVLVSLDNDTRDALGSSIRSLGMTTRGSRQDIDRALSGLGNIGRQGGTAMDALAHQSQDLHQLTTNAGTLLAALNTRQGEIGQMVTSTNELASATAGNGPQIESVMRKLPGVLDTAKNATSGVSDLSSAVSPVTDDLRAAGPELNTALTQMPQSAARLRGILPVLDGALGKAPGTLQRVPATAADASALIPPLHNDLLQLNPMLTYLEPYGMDVAHLLTNWNASLVTGNRDGTALRLLPVLNRQAITGMPVNTNVGPLNARNQYPAPGGATAPTPFVGQYPHVQPKAPAK